MGVRVFGHACLWAEQGVFLGAGASACRRLHPTPHAPIYVAPCASAAARTNGCHMHQLMLPLAHPLPHAPTDALPHASASQKTLVASGSGARTHARTHTRCGRSVQASCAQRVLGSCAHVRMHGGRPCRALCTTAHLRPRAPSPASAPACCLQLRGPHSLPLAHARRARALTRQISCTTPPRRLGQRVRLTPPRLRSDLTAAPVGGIRSACRVILAPRAPPVSSFGHLCHPLPPGRAPRHARPWRRHRSGCCHHWP